MALTVLVDTNVSLIDANAYFRNRLDTAAWDTELDARKEQALATATMLLDDLPWTGVAASETQPLAFPRTGSYFEPKLGMLVMFTTVVPKRVVQATCELANHLLVNADIINPSGGVDDIRIGNISLTKIRNTGVVPYSIKKGILPLLQGGGAKTVWRAN